MGRDVFCGGEGELKMWLNFLVGFIIGLVGTAILTTLGTPLWAMVPIVIIMYVLFNHYFVA